MIMARHATRCYSYLPNSISIHSAAVATCFSCLECPVINVHDLLISLLVQEDSEYVASFWKLLMNFDVVQKKRFLSFVTGSDLAPVGGLQELQLVIQRNGDEPTERLPTAHTCFNLLLLPEHPGEQFGGGVSSLLILYTIS